MYFLNILKKIALSVPAIKRVHSERNCLLQEKNTLQLQLLHEFQKAPPILYKNNDLTELDGIFSDYQTVLWATMPRSGTWYTFYFMELLNAFLTGQTRIATKHGLHRYDGLNLFKYHTHTEFPGVAKPERYEEYERWRKISYSLPGFNDHFSRVEEMRLCFRIELNESLKIVYIFRNPLDQIVSYFDHARDHKDEETRIRKDSSGNISYVNTIGEYIKAGGVDSYIKQYVTHMWGKESYPDSLMAVPYELLINNPSKAFENILSFIGFELDNPAKMKAFNLALENSSMESLKKIEARFKRSLGDDQKEARGSHMAGGSIGKWQKRMTDEEVNFVRARFADFGLSLDKFLLTENDVSEFVAKGKKDWDFS